MESSPRKKFLIVGRDSGLRAALASHLTGFDVDGSPADGAAEPPATVSESTDTAGQADKNLYRSIIWIIDPADGADANAIEEMGRRAEYVNVQCGIQLYLGYRYHLTVIQLTRARTDGDRPEDDTRSRERADVLKQARTAAEEVAAQLRGCQTMVAHVEADPTEDRTTPFTDYEHRVASLLAAALFAHRGEGDIQPFRAFAITRQPDGSPLISPEEG